jgi:hypothetical protein
MLLDLLRINCFHHLAAAATGEGSEAEMATPSKILALERRAAAPVPEWPAMAPPPLFSSSLEVHLNQNVFLLLDLVCHQQKACNFWAVQHSCWSDAFCSLNTH